ncbi:hypothetical protein XENORESO_001984 [Xenotaenia resolanae]|uniref:Uncharacterized protein n=1 Tax=Xenotaenia resolanae TaxID=208358 RepID=A0ABV0W669_9TELE
MSALLMCCVLLLCLCGSGLGELDKCSEVHKVFQVRQIGPNQILPSSPRSGSELQVCTSKSSTCCSKKMEEKYQVAARRDVQNLMQTYSSRLKLLLSRYVAAFQGNCVCLGIAAVAS